MHLSLSDLQTKARNFVSKNQLKQAFKLLRAQLNDQDPSISNSLVDLSRQYNFLMDNWMSSMIEKNDYELGMNKISRALLYLLDKLEKDHLKDQKVAPHLVIANPLLLVGHSGEAMQRIKTLFLALNFTELTVRSLNFMQEQTELKPFDLIVFDNTDLPSCPHPSVFAKLSQEDQALISSRIAIMEEVVQQSSKFMIHFGEFLYWINEHRNHVHPANSQFALYARAREEFINTYRV